MLRALVPLVVLGAAIALAGCNETSGSMLGPQTSVAQAPDAGSGLPPGAPCSSEINSFQSVLKDDLATGNVEQKVYDKIEKDLARASAACAAGNGREAHSIVSATKVRHGYRA